MMNYLMEVILCSFAIDYVDEVEELETLLDSENQTLILKVLTVLKERSQLRDEHKKVSSWKYYI